MDVETADPAGAGLNDLQQGLLGQVVGADDALVCDEEDGFCGVEVCALRRSTTLETFAEGKLCLVLGDGVDGDCLGSRNCRCRTDGHEMVAGGMEGEGFRGVPQMDQHSDTLLSLC